MFQILNPEFLIHTLGYIGVFSIIFLESGFFFAFFLPGDTLLFTIGFYGSLGTISIPLSLTIIIVANYFGTVVGYLFGKRVGNAIFQKESSVFFNPKNLLRTKKFYEKYGTMTVVFSRFVPVVRTFAPILAGVGEMNFKKFLKYNILGSMLWPCVVVSVGYFFGSQLPEIKPYVMPVVIAAFLSTLIPIFFAIIKTVLIKRRLRKNAKI